MRGSCSEQEKRDLSVYDFNPEDLAVEEASEKYRKRSSRFFSSSKSKSNPKEESDPTLKYFFLKTFTAGAKSKQTDGVSFVDLHENGSPQGSSGIDSPERIRPITNEKSELDENKTLSSYGERGNVCQSEFDLETRPRDDCLVREVIGLDVPLVGTEQASNLQSDGTPVDVISDDEETWRSGSVSPSSSASDDIEDEDYLKHPLSEGCTTAEDKDDLAVKISPDYVIYKNTLYGEAELLFFNDSILVTCSDASESNEKIDLEWAIADIVRIECQWSSSTLAALFRFYLKETTVNGYECASDTHDTVELIVSLSDTCWLEKELKIKHLTDRYRDIWKVPQYDHAALKDNSEELDMSFSRDYFAQIPDSFEDVIYPKGDPDAVSISKRDFELLQPDTFINDTIIDFYIKYLKTKIPPDERHRFHFFNSFFFRKLADLDKDPESSSEGRAAFLRVRKWTRKVNIFEKDYIFIPVNFNLHWSLLVICHPGEMSVLKDDEIKESPRVPCILHMDSIKGSHSGLKNLIQSYLLEEWKERHPASSVDDYTSKFSNLRFVPLELPQQENSFDCGLFLLHYVELFLEEAPVNFNPYKISKFSSFLTMDWFIPSEASLKRAYIRKLIYDLLHDSSQKVNSTPCSKGHISTGYNDSTVDQRPTGKLFHQHSGPSKSVHDDSACLITVKGIEMNLETISSPGFVQSDNEEGLVLHEFLEPGKNSMSILPADEPFQMPRSAPCQKKEQADECERLLTSDFDRVDCCPIGESSTGQTCSTSYCLKDAGEIETPWSSLRDKVEIGLDLLPKTFLDVESIETSELGKERSAGIEDCGYVPDSPTSSSGENPEINTRKIDEYGSCRDPLEIETGHCRDPQQTDTSEGDEGRCCKDSQGIDDVTEMKDHNVKSEGSCTAEDEGMDNENHQRTETTENDSEEKDAHDINTCNAEEFVGKDCHVVDVTNEEDGGKQNDCEKINSDIGCGVSDEDSLQMQNSKESVINADENLLRKDAAGVKREEPSTRIEAHHEKRRKVLQSGGRRRTRSFSKDNVP